MDGRKKAAAGGSRQSSPASARSFGSVLSELRERAGFTQEELADKLDVSRGYLSQLESVEGKLPSLQVLKDICKHLILRGGEKTRVQLEQITTLTLAAIETPDATLSEDLLGTLEDETQLQQEQSIHQLWIISDLLGENYRPSLLDTTVSNLQDGVRYAYFVPEGDGVLEWERCRDAILERAKPPKFKPGSLVAVSCPKLIGVMRVRVVNPGMRDSQGSVSLGPVEDVVLHRLQAEQVRDIHKELAPVLSALAVKDSLATPDGARFKRLHPKEGWSND